MGFPSAATQSRIYNEIMELPFDPRGCALQDIWKKKQKKKNRKPDSEICPCFYSSTKCAKNNALFSCTGAPLPGLWLGSGAGLRFQPHVARSNQKSQLWQRGRIAERDGEESCERAGGEREGVTTGRAEKIKTRDVNSPADREDMWRQ